MAITKIDIKNHPILLRYPDWATKVISSVNKPPFPPNYYPETIEMFDQHGLLAGTVYGRVYETTRTQTQPTDFIAWFWDGQLAVFVVSETKELLVNRLSLVQKVGLN